MANLTAIMLAGDLMLKLEQQGKAVAYTLDKTESSVMKGLTVSGLANHPRSKEPTDRFFQMDPQKLLDMARDD